MRFASAAMLALFSLIPGIAHAGCGPGEQPSYGDVRRVQIRRYALIGKTYPRYAADFQLSFFGNGSNALTASLDAQRNVPIAGKYVENDPAAFEKLRYVLELHKFYDMHFTPGRAYYIDGPEDRLVVTRCGVATIIGDAVEGEIDQQNGQVAAMHALFEGLQSVIFSLPWIPVRPFPSPSP